ncbi:MAG: GDSL-type esterase/lipase family protein, partial [Pseudomonadota bacterium]|nr:GDSL-type esterase/lipase family protein [Pseudomonadota bacterium]
MVIRNKLLLLVAAICVSVVFVEFALRVFTEFPIHGRDANRKNHDILGYVVDPELPEIDANGFRNPRQTQPVEWVAIGDSFTYGYGVSSEESWPAQLADRLNRTVYNYGVGGYGIVHYRWLFDLALEKKPQAIVLALFLPNDLEDACKMARNAHSNAEFRKRGLDFSHCETETGNAARDHSNKIRRGGFRGWYLSTALGSAIQEVAIRPLQRYRHPERFTSIHYGDRETILWSRRVQKHRRSTDVEREEIAIALKTLEIFLDEMLLTARAASIRFGVLFIPSKENALFEQIDTDEPLYPMFERTVKQERDLTERLEKFLLERGV